MNFQRSKPLDNYAKIDDNSTKDLYYSIQGRRYRRKWKWESSQLKK